MTFISDIRRRSSVFLGRSDSKRSQRRYSLDSSEESDSEVTGASSPEMATSQKSSSPPDEMPQDPSQLQLSTAPQLQAPGTEALSSTNLEEQTGPRLTNVADGIWFCYPVVLLRGSVPVTLSQGGILRLRYATDRQPRTEWEVNHTRFKALAYLEPGENEIILEYVTDGAAERCISKYTLWYHPMDSCQRVKLVMLQARSSKLALESSSAPGETFLSVTTAKFRMAAYLWQAYLGDRMHNSNYGRRTFQLESVEQHSTMYSQDQETGQKRREAPIYNVILDRTVDELKLLSETEMISCVERALANQFGEEQEHNIRHFACMFLDAEWDDTNKALLGAISYGGRRTSRCPNLALFGAHLTFSYPSSIDTVLQAFKNGTPTPGLPGTTKGECASLGIGTHLKQVGYMLDLPDQTEGIMGKEFAQFGRAFSFQDSSKGVEPQLHFLDMIRLRYHPLLTFQMPFLEIESDLLPNTSGIVIWGKSKAKVSINSWAGITAIEILLSADSVCHHWLNMLDANRRPRSKVQLRLTDVLKQIPPSRSRTRFLSPSGPFALRILTTDGSVTPIGNFTEFARGLTRRVPGDKRNISRSQPIGTAAENSTRTSIVFPRSLKMLAVKVYSTSNSVVGLEFVFTGGTKLFGARNSDMPSIVKFELTKEYETLMGLELRVKRQVCGMRLFTSLGKQSVWFGDVNGGIEYTLLPPTTYGFAGLEGNFGESISTVQMIAAQH